MGKYTPDPRKPDQKEWLYELYWGEFLSTADMAERCDFSTRFIRQKLRELGIPRRGQKYGKDTTISPFNGFYTNSPTQARKDPNSHFDPEKQNQSEQPNWADVADRDPAIGEAATFGD